MLEFELARPQTLAEAVRLLNTEDPLVRPISGGTGLMLMMKTGVFSPSLLVDLTGIEKRYHGVHLDTAGTLRVGAMVTLSELERNRDVVKSFPVIPATMARLSNVRVRNVARVGGNLAHADPHMDLPPVLAALKATVTTRGPDGVRELPIEALSSGYYETILQQGELIAEVTVPRAGDWQTVYRKVTLRTHDDWPTVGVAVSVSGTRSRIHGARVAVSAVTDRVTVLPGTNEALLGRRPDSALFKEYAEAAASGIDTIDDSQGSASYKRSLLGVEIRRALEAAVRKCPE